MIDGLTLTEVESRVHQLCVETHFLYGYRKIHALLAKETKCSVSKVQRICANTDGIAALRSSGLINHAIHTRCLLTSSTEVGRRTRR
ncbi:IS3 family transposase [Pediococcus cellicola]|uniref:IS3 family transposase n=1 Tax=Pediococcus cellicola TaxID=319652 RepID=UPI003610B479